MRPTPWTDTHDRLLTDAAPPEVVPTPEDLDRIWARVAATVEGGTAGARRMRRRTTGRSSRR